MEGLHFNQTPLNAHTLYIPEKIIYISQLLRTRGEIENTKVFIPTKSSKATKY